MANALYEAPPANPDLTVVRAVQATLAAPHVVNAAKAVSLFGEHAIGWLALGVHYPTDVVAGSLLGAFIGGSAR